MALKSINKDPINVLCVQRTHKMLLCSCTGCRVRKVVMECHQTNTEDSVLKLPLPRQIANAYLM